VPQGRSVMVQNTGSALVYLGGSGVTADTSATGGIQVGAFATAVEIPSGNVAGRADADDRLYGIVASGTGIISYFVAAP
jgi:hypothetical protein